MSPDEAVREARGVGKAYWCYRCMRDSVCAGACGLRDLRLIRSCRIHRVARAIQLSPDDAGRHIASVQFPPTASESTSPTTSPTDSEDFVTEMLAGPPLSWVAAQDDDDLYVDQGLLWESAPALAEAAVGAAGW